MQEVLFFVCSKKKNPAIRHKRHPCLKLSHSTLVFPLEAKEELSKIAPPKTFLVPAAFPEEKLDESNASWLGDRKLSVEIGGEAFITPFLKELEVLCDWRSKGVSESEEDEYLGRKKGLEREWAAVSPHLFPGKFAQGIQEKIRLLGSFSPSSAPFAGKRANLSRTMSERFEKFSGEVLELLRKPRDLSEIARVSGMSKSNARKLLRRMARKGLVAKTRKRHGVGRPRDVYYLSMRVA